MNARGPFRPASRKPHSPAPRRSLRLSSAYRSISDRDIGNANSAPCRISTKVELGEDGSLGQRRGWRSCDASKAASMDFFYWVRRSAVVGIAAVPTVADHRDAERVCQDQGGARHSKTREKCLQHNQSGREQSDRTVVWMCDRGSGHGALARKLPLVGNRTSRFRDVKSPFACGRVQERILWPSIPRSRCDRLGEQGRFKP